MQGKKFIPVMLTPFNEDGSIDYKGLTTLTEFYLAQGAKGLFANCLSSEMFELSREERLNSVKHVLDIVKGKVPVVATGTFNEPLEQQAAFTREMYALGVDAVIVITGLMAAEGDGDEIMDENMKRFMELTPGVLLGFYECPVPYKRVLTAAQLGKYAAEGRIIYHKDTSLDINSIKAKLQAVTAPDFGLYDAYMVHAVDTLKVGSAGLSCIQGNYFPEVITWLCDHYNDAARKEKVDSVQRFLIDNMDVMHDVYPIVAKYFLQKRGLPISLYTRREVGVLTDEIKAKVDVLYADYEKLKAELI